MDLVDQVSSIEPSKKLKELGVKQDSLFYWIESAAFPIEVVSKAKRDSVMKEKQFWGDRMSELYYYSAYTVAELGELLKNNLDSYYTDHDEEYHISAFGHAIMIIDNKEADARAKLLIYLLNNKTISKVEEK